MIRECILALDHPEPDLDPAEICKKFFHLTVLGSGLCLMNETEVYFYQLLTVELSNLFLLPSLPQQHKLRSLSHFSDCSSCGT